MDKFGNRIDLIGSNIVLLIMQVILFLAIAGAVIYFVLIAKIVTPDTTTLSPMVFDIISYGLIGVMGLMALYSILRIAFNKIEIYEKGMVVKSFFKSTEIPYENIGHFEWLIQTTRYGFIPLGRVCQVTIFDNSNARIAFAASTDYSKLQKKLGSLEDKLGI